MCLVLPVASCSEKETLYNAFFIFWKIGENEFPRPSGLRVNVNKYMLHRYDPKASTFLSHCLPFFCVSQVNSPEWEWSCAKTSRKSSRWRVYERRSTVLGNTTIKFFYLAKLTLAWMLAVVVVSIFVVLVFPHELRIIIAYGILQSARLPFWQIRICLSTVQKLQIAYDKY